MFSRIVNFTVNPAKAEEFRTALNDQLVPRIREQRGFVDNIESFDTKSGQFCCVTLWKSATDVENYEQGFFKEIASRLQPFLQSSPTAQTLPVEYSSAHNIQAGKKAAA
jgi:heme-degrading monooxygenase HmoA